MKRAISILAIILFNIALHSQTSESKKINNSIEIKCKKTNSLYNFVTLLDHPETLLFIEGKKVDNNKLPKIKCSNIAVILKDKGGEYLIEKYGKRGKYGVINVILLH